MSEPNESADQIMSVLHPGFSLTAREIRARAPNARRVSYTLGVLQKRGVVRRVGVVHTMENGTEVTFTSVKKT
ncbi:hypothetical protein [Burkholderia ubonensis]|uniref:hypothetical protein n=1 Tax=Burkholderia ubonensis TaxID=101571 RepID=UPI000B1572FE|nr:hypothetical protein [Burkholderia ubonensis]